MHNARTVLRISWLKLPINWRLLSQIKLEIRNVLRFLDENLKTDNRLLSINQSINQSAFFTGLQHLYKPGMCSRTTWSRPRPKPQNFVLEVYSRSRPVLENPHTYRLFLPRDATQIAFMPSRLSVHHLISNSTPYCRLLCACVWTMKYCIYGIESFTYHTQKFNVLRPDLEATHRRGQGQGHKILSSRCPRGRGQSSKTPSLQ